MNYFARPIAPLVATSVVLFSLLAHPAWAEPQQAPKTTVAVMGFGLKSDFESAYGSTAAGGGLTAMLSSELEQTGQFLIVERPGLSDVFSEQELTAAGLVRPESAAAPGQLIGAQILVSGEVTEFSQAESGETGSMGIGGIGSNNFGIGLAPSSRKGVIGVDVRLIDATTSQVLSSFHVREEVESKSLGLKLVFKDASIAQSSFNDSALGKAARKAMAQIVQRIVAAAAETPWSGRVVDVDADEVAINAGGKAGIEVGERYQIFRITKVLRDPTTGRVLGERKRRVGEITIVEVDAEVAFGRFVQGDHGVPKNNDLVTL